MFSNTLRKNQPYPPPPGGSPSSLAGSNSPSSPAAAAAANTTPSTARRYGGGGGGVNNNNNNTAILLLSTPKTSSATTASTATTTTTADARVALRESIRAIISNPKRYGPLFDCVSAEYQFVANLGNVSSADQPHFFDAIATARKQKSSLFDDDDGEEAERKKREQQQQQRGSVAALSSQRVVQQMRRSIGNALTFSMSTDVRDVEKDGRRQDNEEEEEEDEEEEQQQNTPSNNRGGNSKKIASNSNDSSDDEIDNVFEVLQKKKQQQQQQLVSAKNVAAFSSSSSSLPAVGTSFGSTSGALVASIQPAKPAAADPNAAALTTLSKELTTVRRKLAELQSQREQFHTTLERTQLDLGAKASALVKLREVVNDVTDRDKRKTDRIKELESDLGDMRRELGVAQDRVRDSAQVSTVASTTARSSGDPHVERRFREMRQEIGQLQRALSTAEDRISTLQRENAVVSDDRDASESRHADVLRELEDARAELRFKDQTILDLNFQNNEKRKWAMLLGRFLSESLLYLGRSSMLDVLSFAHESAAAMASSKKQQQHQQQHHHHHGASSESAGNQINNNNNSSALHIDTNFIASYAASLTAAGPQQQQQQQQQPGAVSLSASAAAPAPGALSPKLQLAITDVEDIGDIWRMWVSNTDICSRLLRAPHRAVQVTVAQRTTQLWNRLVATRVIEINQQLTQIQQQSGSPTMTGTAASAASMATPAELNKQQTALLSMRRCWWHRIMQLHAGEEDDAMLRQLATWMPADSATVVLEHFAAVSEDEEEHGAAAPAASSSAAAPNNNNNNNNNNSNVNPAAVSSALAAAKHNQRLLQQPAWTAVVVSSFGAPTAPNSSSSNQTTSFAPLQMVIPPSSRRSRARGRKKALQQQIQQLQMLQGGTSNNSSSNNFNFFSSPAFQHHSHCKTVPVVRRDVHSLKNERSVNLLDLVEHRCYLAQVVTEIWTAKQRRSLAHQMRNAATAQHPIYEPKVLAPRFGSALAARAELSKFAVNFFALRCSHVRQAQEGSYSIHCPMPSDYQVGRTVSVGFCGQYEQLLPFPRHLVPLTSFLNRYAELYNDATLLMDLTPKQQKQQQQQQNNQPSSTAHHHSAEHQQQIKKGHTSNGIVLSVDFPECNSQLLQTSEQADRGVQFGRKLFATGNDSCPIESSQPLARVFDCVAATASGAVALASLEQYPDEVAAQPASRNSALHNADAASNVYKSLAEHVLGTPDGDALLKLFYLVSHRVVPEQLAVDIFFNLDLLTALAVDKHIEAQQNTREMMNKKKKKMDDASGGGASSWRQDSEAQAATLPSGTISLPVLTHLLVENGFVFRHSVTPMFVQNTNNSSSSNNPAAASPSASPAAASLGATTSATAPPSSPAAAAAAAGATTSTGPGRSSMTVTDAGSFRRWSFTKLEVSRLVFALSADFPHQTQFPIDALACEAPHRGGGAASAHLAGGGAGSVVSRFAQEYIKIALDRFEADRAALWESVVAPLIVDASQFAAQLKKGGKLPFEFLPVSMYAPWAVPSCASSSAAAAAAAGGGSSDKSKKNSRRDENDDDDDQEEDEKQQQHKHKKETTQKEQHQHHHHQPDHRRAVPVPKFVESFSKLHRPDMAEMEVEQLVLALSRAFHDHSKVPAMDALSSPNLASSSDSGTTTEELQSSMKHHHHHHQKQHQRNSGSVSSPLLSPRGSPRRGRGFEDYDDGDDTSSFPPVESVRSVPPELRVLCTGRMHDILLLRCLSTKEAKSVAKEGAAAADQDVANSSFNFGRVASMAVASSFRRENTAAPQPSPSSSSPLDDGSLLQQQHSSMDGSGGDFGPMANLVSTSSGVLLPPGSQPEVIPTTVDIISAHGFVDVFYAALHAGSHRDEETLMRIHEQLLSSSTQAVAVAPPKPATKKTKQFYSLPPFVSLDVLKHRFNVLYSGVFRPTTGTSSFAEAADLKAVGDPRHQMKREQHERERRKSMTGAGQLLPTCTSGAETTVTGAESSEQQQQPSQVEDDIFIDDDEFDAAAALSPPSNKLRKRRAGLPLKQRVNAVMTALSLAKNNKRSVFQILSEQVVTHISNPHVLDHGQLSVRACDRAAAVWNRAFDKLPELRSDEGMVPRSYNLMMKNESSSLSSPPAASSHGAFSDAFAASSSPTTTAAAAAAKPRSFGAPDEAREMLHAAEQIAGFSFVEDSPDYAQWKIKTQTLAGFWADLGRPPMELVDWIMARMGQTSAAITTATAPPALLAAAAEQPQREGLTTPGSPASPGLAALSPFAAASQTNLFSSTGSPFASARHLRRKGSSRGDDHNNQHHRQHQMLTLPVAHYLREMAPQFAPLSHSALMCYSFLDIQLQQQQAAAQATFMDPHPLVDLPLNSQRALDAIMTGRPAATVLAAVAAAQSSGGAGGDVSSTSTLAQPIQALHALRDRCIALRTAEGGLSRRRDSQVASNIKEHDKEIYEKQQQRQQARGTTTRPPGGGSGGDIAVPMSLTPMVMPLPMPPGRGARR